ncbi:alpha/beta hydrolase [Streptomyces ipomoeae]|uniref:alpha/beta hydrolase n=1 Tax=Streptomyces ipomoeae TaxID=103232 RepID=UPI00114744A6|nr:alpha/beta hydrolase [Streptomyces ipomoeae]MDX2823840.1 alpha/beta hydrolase [Streptomyces ipomoeae]MDX2876448.1 alpha/beta hydrolase [Streptomyces ipomoeae]TQE26286.1 alpha/beta hydrolase [Streptomyces ipomoeae]
MPLSDNCIFDLDDNVTRTPVPYKNRFGITIAADLYRPKDFDESQGHPAIVIGAPYGGVKEQGPGIYAQNLALRGFVALTFDPSFNGYSGGQPRHVSSPDLFVEDFSAAVDYLGTRPFVDRERIGGIGMCGSGGFLLSAAQVDRRLKAVATIVMYDISRVASKGFHDLLSDEERGGMLDVLAEQRYADFEGHAPALTPRGAPIGFDDTTDPIGREFGEFYSTPRGYHPNSITQFTMTSLMSFMNFPLLTHIESISPRPILFVVGEHAHSRYFSEDAYELAAEPKEFYAVPNAGHVDLYDKTDLIPFDKLEEFFTKNLA